MEILRKNQKEVLEIKQKQNKKPTDTKLSMLLDGSSTCIFLKSMKMTIYCLEKGKHDSKEKLKLIIKESN